ncbi:hypothetical protein QN277_014894 [Acacia crassicarpa]|uniref:DEP domain-containing protein n=1 Tax=Acacia crassicarpa TaxID=499986 RepID=A0AAE1JUH7_9FABA|nr:hypothetical protein QN277_014894 [Acacia crassicarpa]
MEKEPGKTHGAQSQAVEMQRLDELKIQSEDLGKKIDEVETQIIGHDGPPKLDNRQDDRSFQTSEMKGFKSKTSEGMANNLVGKSDFAERIGEVKDLQCKSKQENLEIRIVIDESCHEVPESVVLKSEIPNELFNFVNSSYKVNENVTEKNIQEDDADKKSLQNDLAKEMEDNRKLVTVEVNQKADECLSEDRSLDLVFDGRKDPEMEASTSKSTCSLEADQQNQGIGEKAGAFENIIRQRSLIAVSTLMRRLSGKRDKGSMCISGDQGKDVSESSKDSEFKMDLEKVAETHALSPVNFFKIYSNVSVENKTEGPPQPIAMKGRVILYSRSGCPECKEVRLFLYMKRLRYIEINVDVYPSRKLELGKISGDASVPKVFFSEILIGGLDELKALDKSGKLNEKIDFLINEAPSFEAPLPPLSGEDDVSSSRAPDEMALIVRKMRESIVVKDRFWRLRRFTNCFLGSEALDFLSEDQCLERQEAVQFARKLASKLFFHHVLDENLFEDGNHLYRFLDEDPIVASHCHNIPRGIITLKPKPIAEIASRLRFLSYAMFEAYASEDGSHVDYRSLHGSEEFARYLRIVEELQRVEIWETSREEKLAFFVNLYNMMAIHAILVWGHPAGALERRKMFDDFKYVIGGCTYSLSSIQNGILRGNQRPPYSLMKPFGAKDKRSRVALPYPETLVHFALVCGTRSGPALRCYSPRDIDEELLDAARRFLRSGGLTIDMNANVAYASKILKWFSTDFGKDDVEVLKHVSNYLNPADSTALLDLLSTSELKVVYQTYDWALNC